MSRLGQPNLWQAARFIWFLVAVSKVFSLLEPFPREIIGWIDSAPKSARPAAFETYGWRPVVDFFPDDFFSSLPSSSLSSFTSRELLAVAGVVDLLPRCLLLLSNWTACAPKPPPPTTFETYGRCRVVVPCTIVGPTVPVDSGHPLQPFLHCVQRAPFVHELLRLLRGTCRVRIHTWYPNVDGRSAIDSRVRRTLL